MPWVLGSLSMQVRPGELLVVCGGMGCGKTSLLLGLLGEMHLLDGSVTVCEGRSRDTFDHDVVQSEEDTDARPTFGYCGQRPWISRATIRDNIVFGRPFHQERYSEVLRAVSLEKDLSSWPRGDRTEAGDAGSNALSGGQQSRVALARVLYARPRVALLDEPLAALDPTTRAHVWSQAIRGPLLRQSAVILTSSSTTAGLHADHVMLLSEGAVLQSGPAVALAAAPGPLAAAATG